MPAIGTAACLACTREVVVQENANGTHNWNCRHCDMSAWCKKGTEAQRMLEKKIKRYQVDPPPAPPKKPGEDPAPPVKKNKYGDYVA